MGLTCSKAQSNHVPTCTRQDSPDPFMFDLTRKSMELTQEEASSMGQHHLLYQYNKQSSNHHHHHKASKPQSPEVDSRNEKKKKNPNPTRLVLRRHSPRHYEEGCSGTHIYCVRYPANVALDSKGRELAAVEAAPTKNQPQPVTEDDKDDKKASSAPLMANNNKSNIGSGNNNSIKKESLSNVDLLFKPSTMALPPQRNIVDWVTVSEEHNIYICDTGLSVAECDEIVQVTEQVCRGQYAAYTYAKQTLGCREYPVLANVVQAAVHTVTYAICSRMQKKTGLLALDDREPHMVKYDVTKRERQKLDMHTDKSEWTFLISLSNPCGVDYEGGGTYFECLDATVHLQRGHALVFPGKLRHCGQRITSGLRFLLVGFLVDKSTKVDVSSSSQDAMPTMIHNIP